ncbi:MAG: outer membrane lipoprotein-sorting protein [Nitrospirae bacterium]|nr:outer membrane lipoprotein-sorting protein [Candidatus Troglogloeales bacterium]
MTPRLFFAPALLLFLMTPSFSVFSHAEEPVPAKKAESLLKKIDDLWRGQSSHGTVSMTVKTAHYSRAMKIAVWSKGKEQSLVRILLPLKEKGTATLKFGRNIYTYLPKTDRTIRLTDLPFIFGRDCLCNTMISLIKLSVL